MSRLLALSIVLHGLFLVAIIYVPTLQSMLYVAGSVSGFKLVSEDYDPSLIGQRATIVQLEPHQKLVYPPDYFGAPAVEETTQLDQTTFVQQQYIPPPVVIYKPRRARTPRAQAVPSPSPELSETAQATPTPTPSTDDEKKADDAELDKVAKQYGIERPPVINTKPFEDIALKGKELINQGKLDLKNSTIDVTATAERNDDGTLKAETVKFDWRNAGDETTSLLAQQLISALSESKTFSMLNGAKDVRIALKLDQDNVSIIVLSELPTENAAETNANGYGALVALGRMAKRGTNEGELYNHLKFGNEGKQFTMSFEMSKDDAGKIIADMLAKKAAKDAAALKQNKS